MTQTWFEDESFQGVTVSELLNALSTANPEALVTLGGAAIGYAVDQGESFILVEESCVGSCGGLGRGNGVHTMASEECDAWFAARDMPPCRYPEEHHPYRKAIYQ